MPNWTSNSLTVSGKAADIKRFVAKVKSKERRFDFDNIVPMPKELEGISTGSCTIRGKRCSMWREMGSDGAPEPIGEAELTAIKKAAGGHHSWYDWSCANWGTKWNANNVSGPTRCGDDVAYHFDTAWSAPMPVLVAASKLFPTLSLHLHCDYEGDSHWDEFTIKAGKITDGPSGEHENEEEE